MERKTLGKLLKWKEKKNRKPLLMTGVRQCGKTYIIKEFGKQEFEDTAYFNFDGNTGLKSIFDFDFDRAYVFDDCYLSGEDFASYYDLDISIEEVETGLQDYNNRIVFVDDQGEFIYEFVYESYILNPYEDGMIIYPDTEFEFYEQQKDDGVVFKIHSTDYYNKEK